MKVIRQIKGSRIEEVTLNQCFKAINALQHEKLIGRNVTFFDRPASGSDRFWSISNTHPHLDQPNGSTIAAAVRAKDLSCKITSSSERVAGKAVYLRQITSANVTQHDGTPGVFSCSCAKAIRFVGSQTESPEA